VSGVDDGQERDPGPGDPTGVAARTTGASLLRGGAWTVVAYVLPQVFTLLVSVAAARYLGPRDMGRQSYISFLTSALAMVLALGLPVAVQRFSAASAGGGRPGQVRGLARWAVRRAFMLALLVFVVVSSMQTWTYPDLGTAWTLAGVVGAIAVLHAVAAQLLMGLQKWRLATVFGVLAGALNVLVTVVVLELGYGITAIFAAEVVSGIFSLAATALAAVRVLRRLGPAEKIEKHLAHDVSVFAGISAVGVLVEVLLTRRSEFFFLQAYSPDEQIAIYSIAFAAVAAAARVPQAIVSVVLPAVSTMVGAGRGDVVAEGYQRAMRLMFLLAVPSAAVAVALGPIAVRVVYGSDYSAAGDVLRLLAPAQLSIGPLAAVATATLGGLGRPLVALLCATSGLVINLGLALVLVPQMDARGAALAYGAGQLVSGSLVIVAASRVLERGWLERRLWRPMVTGVAAGAAGAAGALSESAVGAGPALCLGLLGAATAFFTIGRATQVLTEADGDLLKSAVGPRFAGVRRVVGLLAGE